MWLRSCKVAQLLLGAGTLALLVAAAASPATPASKTNPPAASARPLLDQLNRETQELYGQVQGSLVRLQLPTPRWMSDATADGNPLSKYGNLDPEFRRHLESQPQSTHSFGPGAPLPPPPQQQQPDDRGGETSPSTQPTPQSDGEPRLNARGRVIVIPPLIFADPQRDALLGGRLRLELGADPAAGAFAPNSVALRLDDAGHVLVPLYLEPETCAAHPVRCAGPQGRVVEAKFVGSDRQTNLTVLRIAPPPIDGTATTRPSLTVRFREAEQVNDRPADGSLLLYVSPADGSGRLGLWGGAAQEFGLVYQTDGAFAGIARYGQFLSGRACRLIADQLVEHGSVRRATLGVVISELRHDDPLRRQLPAVLGAHTAMRVEQVVPGSAAEKAGLRRGDLLLTLAGEAVSDIPSLAASIAARSGRTELQILRDGQVRQVVVDLEPK